MTVPTCENWKEAISSLADGQTDEVGLTEIDIDRHIADCSDCAAFAAFLPQLKRRGMAKAAPMPDLSGRITKSIQLTAGLSKWVILRVILAVCAVEILFFSLQDFLAATHEERHLGAFSAAVGIAFFMVALRPTRARMMLPVAVVLGLALMLGAVVDIASGRIPLLTEARHIPELISICIVWLLALPSRSARQKPSSKTTAWVPRIISNSDDQIEGTA